MYESAARAARPIGGTSFLTQPSSALEQAWDWWFKFRVLLRRNLLVYARSPANALARTIGYQGLSLVASAVLYRIGFLKGMLKLNIFMGTLD